MEGTEEDIVFRDLRSAFPSTPDMYLRSLISRGLAQARAPTSVFSSSSGRPKAKAKAKATAKGKAKEVRSTVTKTQKQVLSEAMDFVVNFLLETGEVATGENHTTSSSATPSSPSFSLASTSPIDLAIWEEVTKDVERIGKGKKSKEQEDRNEKEKPITFVAKREEFGEGSKGKEEELDAVDGVTSPPNGLSLTSLANDLQLLRTLFSDIDEVVVVECLQKAYMNHSFDAIRALGDKRLEKEKEEERKREEEEALFISQAESISMMLPDADLEYIFQQLHSVEKEKSRVEIVSNRMLENRNYPKKKEKEQKKTSSSSSTSASGLQVTEELKEQWRREMTGEDFKMDYYETSTPVSKEYESNCVIQLGEDFPLTSKMFIRTIMSQQNNHYLPALRALESIHRNAGDEKHKSRGAPSWRMKSARTAEALPHPDLEAFQKEKFYAEHEREIEETKERNKKEREKALREAEQDGQLIECGCCFTEYLFDEMTTCGDGHLFCLECAEKAAQEVIGGGGWRLSCLDFNGCKFEFPVSQAKRFLKKAQFDLLQKRLQDEEIQKANIPGLVGCPFCNFAVILPEEERIFLCMNPRCMKESCRFCKEPSHIPLRCEEVERDNEVKMRTFIEEKMTEALLVNCYKCKKNYYKTEGCNHMTCTCGAEMCYVCKAPLKRPWGDHFGPGKCASSSDTGNLNQNRMLAAGKRALEDYAVNHEDAPEILKYNPLGSSSRRKRVRVNFPVAPQPASPLPVPATSSLGPVILPTPAQSRNPATAKRRRKR